MGRFAQFPLMVTSCKSVIITTLIFSRYRTFSSPPGSFMCYGCTHSPPPPLTLSTICIMLSFPKCYINGIRRYITFWDLLFSSLGMNLWKFIQIVVCINCSFLLLNNNPWYGLPHCLIIHSLKDIWIVSSLGLIWIQALTLVYGFLWEHRSSFLCMKSWVLYYVVLCSQ